MEAQPDSTVCIIITLDGGPDMLKYKNVVFDFGNVIATFDEDYILGKFCDSTEDLELLRNAVFYNWAQLDEGTADYDTSI